MSFKGQTVLLCRQRRLHTGNEEATSGKPGIDIGSTQGTCRTPGSLQENGSRPGMYANPPRVPGRCSSGPPGNEVGGSSVASSPSIKAGPLKPPPASPLGRCRTQLHDPRPSSPAVIGPDSGFSSFARSEKSFGALPRSASNLGSEKLLWLFQSRGKMTAAGSCRRRGRIRPASRHRTASNLAPVRHFDPRTQCRTQIRRKHLARCSLVRSSTCRFSTAGTAPRGEPALAPARLARWGSVDLAEPLHCRKVWAAAGGFEFSSGMDCHGCCVGSSVNSGRLQRTIRSLHGA